MVEQCLQALAAWQAGFELTDLLWLAGFIAAAVVLAKTAAKVIKFLLITAMVVLAAIFLLASGILPISIPGL